MSGRDTLAAFQQINFEEFQRKIEEKIIKQNTQIGELLDQNLELSNKVTTLEVQLGYTQGAVASTLKENNFVFGSDDIARFLFNQKLYIHNQNHKTQQPSLKQNYVLEHVFSALIFELDQYVKASQVGPEYFQNNTILNLTILGTNLMNFILPDILQREFNKFEQKQKLQKKTDENLLSNKIRDLEQQGFYLSRNCDEIGPLKTELKKMNEMFTLSTSTRQINQLQQKLSELDDRLIKLQEQVYVDEKTINTLIGQQASYLTLERYNQDKQSSIGATTNIQPKDQIALSFQEYDLIKKLEDRINSIDAYIKEKKFDQKLNLMKQQIEFSNEKKATEAVQNAFNNWTAEHILKRQIENANFKSQITDYIKEQLTLNMKNIEEKLNSSQQQLLDAIAEHKLKIDKLFAQWENKIGSFQWKAPGPEFNLKVSQQNQFQQQQQNQYQQQPAEFKAQIIQNISGQQSMQQPIWDNLKKEQSQFQTQTQNQQLGKFPLSNQMAPQQVPQQQFRVTMNQPHAVNQNFLHITSSQNQFNLTMNQSNIQKQQASQIQQTVPTTEKANPNLFDELQTKSKIRIGIKQKYYEIDHPHKIRYQIVEDKINLLYDKSCRLRSAQGDQQLFVKDKLSFQELCKNYGIRSSEQKNKLSKICNSYRQARGDGNCFYTSFGFQFFQILLVEYEDEDYEQFLKEMDKIITFKLKHDQIFEIEKELQDQLWQELKYRLSFLRNIKEKDLRIEEFTKHYASYEQNYEFNLIDGCFYGLSTIFFRNLAYLVIDKSQMKDHVYDKENLLIWEEECNSNEIVIAELAKFLNVHVKLLFFDSGSFQLREYCQEMSHTIILLIQPGHYNSGYYDKQQ